MNTAKECRKIAKECRTIKQTKTPDPLKLKLLASALAIEDENEIDNVTGLEQLTQCWVVVKTQAMAEPMHSHHLFHVFSESSCPIRDEISALSHFM